MHKTIIAVYKQQDYAVKAIKSLNEAGFTKKHISLIGKLPGDETNEEHTGKVLLRDSSVSLTLGVAAGVLTGVGLIAIPGLGFIYGAGALVGGIVGFDLGAIASGIVANLLLDGEKSLITDAYDEEIKNGNTLVVVKVHPEKADKAMETIKALANFKDVQMH